MAATAGGVAIGSVVGHGLSNAIFGGGSGGAPQAAPQAAGGYGGQEQGTYGQQAAAQPQPCEGEMGQFLQCSMNATDLNDCQAYMDMLKKCRDQIMQQQGY